MSAAATVAISKEDKKRRKRKRGADLSYAAVEAQHLNEFNITVEEVSDVSDAEEAIEVDAAPKKTKSANDSDLESPSEVSKSSSEISAVSSAEGRSIYIEGISYDANEDDLRSYFEACGTITSVRMPRFLFELCSPHTEI